MVERKLPQFTTRIEKKGGAILISQYIPMEYIRKVMEEAK